MAGTIAKAPLMEDAFSIAGGASGVVAGAGVGAIGIGAAGVGYAASRMKNNRDAGLYPRGRINRVPKLSRGGLIAGGLGVAAIATGVSSISSGLEGFATNPFVNRSREQAGRLNANGNIVLGAHNSRRGY